jgi:hypothetical protein
MKAFLFMPIVQYHVKTTGHGNDKLLQGAMGMRASVRPPRDVIKVIYTLDVKGDVPGIFYERQIATGIGDLGEFDDFAPRDWH